MLNLSLGSIPTVGSSNISNLGSWINASAKNNIFTLYKSNYICKYLTQRESSRFVYNSTTFLYLNAPKT